MFAWLEVQHLLKPLVVSWGYETETPGPSKFIDQFEWTGTRDIASFLSVPAAIEFQQEHNWEKVCMACHDLVKESQERICSLFDLIPLSDESWCWQFCVAPLPRTTDCDDLKTRLFDEYRIEIPVIRWNGFKLMRTSVQGYNTRRDVNKLLEALQKINKNGSRNK